jgi:hypothetical protein
MTIGPREIVTPFRPIPLEVPEGMKPNEFFNSTENLNDLVNNNGLLVSPEHLLLYRKALGHSCEFDCSIIYNSSQTILNPLGRPVRRTQVPAAVKHAWNRMNQILLAYILETYPDPGDALVLAGEASLDATWPLTSPGVPSIRMLHNHFIVFPMEQLRQAPLADPANPNLTDGGQNSLFQAHMRHVYRRFFAEALDLHILQTIHSDESQLTLTGYPEGLPCWEIRGGVEALKDIRFWREYDAILEGFLDFYRTFFSQVSSRNAPRLDDLHYPEAVDRVLLFDNDFLGTARRVRERCIREPGLRQLHSLATGLQAAHLSQRHRQTAGHHQSEFHRQRHHRTPGRGGAAGAGRRRLRHLRATPAGEASDGPRTPDRGRPGRGHRHR